MGRGSARPLGCRGGGARGPPCLGCPGGGGGARPSGPASCRLPDPCHNGGSCTDGVNTAFCDCLPGFQGAFCEEDINECASNPCHNGANCTDCVDSYTCTCPTGFSGIHCENNTPDCTERCVAAERGGPGPRARVGRGPCPQRLCSCAQCVPGWHLGPVRCSRVLLVAWQWLIVWQWQCHTCHVTWEQDPWQRVLKNWGATSSQTCNHLLSLFAWAARELGLKRPPRPPPGFCPSSRPCGVCSSSSSLALSQPLHPACVTKLLSA